MNMPANNPARFKIPLRPHGRRNGNRDSLALNLASGQIGALFSKYLLLNLVTAEPAGL